ncbi:hypothetical protein FCM35_KLT19917 [Carex littledalei]|uniref:Uncharacterized protein n=1 Tax=Carex littledalei TaxID=544730 RepID=A0A833QYK4_9POAL|nr:hypothetical protein FCM35_KLT19917 [Carex littledalei]
MCSNGVGREEVIERDFTFSREIYLELGNNFLVGRLVNMPRCFAELVIDEWVCILAFDSLAPRFPSSFPPILDPSINPKLASVSSLLNDLKIVLELMRLAQVPLNPISNAGLQNSFVPEQDGRLCQPDISANTPPFLASTNLDDAPYLADEKLHDPQPFAEHDENTIDDLDDILLLNSEDLALILAHLDLDDPLLLTNADGQIPAFNTNTVENFEENEQGFQGPKAPNVEDKDSLRKHPVIEGLAGQVNQQEQENISEAVQEVEQLQKKLQLEKEAIQKRPYYSSGENFTEDLLMKEE